MIDTRVCMKPYDSLVQAASAVVCFPLEIESIND
jgi:hypothetical protein